MYNLFGFKKYKNIIIWTIAGLLTFQQNKNQPTSTYSTHGHKNKNLRAYYRANRKAITVHAIDCRTIMNYNGPLSQGFSGDSVYPSFLPTTSWTESHFEVISLALPHSRPLCRSPAYSLVSKNTISREFHRVILYSHILSRVLHPGILYFHRLSGYREPIIHS